MRIIYRNKEYWINQIGVDMDSSPISQVASIAFKNGHLHYLKRPTLHESSLVKFLHWLSLLKYHSYALPVSAAFLPISTRVLASSTTPPPSLVCFKVDEEFSEKEVLVLLLWKKRKKKKTKIVEGIGSFAKFVVGLRKLCCCDVSMVPEMKDLDKLFNL
ncbi:hypothetical protein HID58_046795 [Brassica napus]|uniref:Uncharacterized protein n=1 Tax=Brassica napus TaxID=3708 RepID=A0ABQ8AXI7_BRANA|nr:hypothetical protein HID58_046795 [Brassica napus]